MASRLQEYILLIEIQCKYRPGQKSTFIPESLAEKSGLAYIPFHSPAPFLHSQKERMDTCEESEIKEKRREAIERKKTLLKKQPGMCAYFMHYKGMYNMHVIATYCYQEKFSGPTISNLLFL